MKKIIGPVCLVAMVTFTACSMYKVSVGDRKPAALYEVPSDLKGRNVIEDHNKNFLDIKKVQTFVKWVRTNPIPMFETLRKEAPLFETGQIPGVRKYIPHKEKSGKLPPTLVVTLDEDVRKVLSNPKIFSVRLYQRKMDQSVGSYMLGNDEQKVNQEKPWMRSMLRREDLPKVKELVRELTLNAIKEGNVNGRMEIVNAVARRVPLELSGKYFGFPGPDLRTMYRWSRDTQYSFFHNAKNDKLYEQNAIRSAKEMHEHLTGFLKEKRESKSYLKGDTVLDRMMQANVPDGEMLDMFDGRVRTNIIGTLVGGVETTQAAIVQVMDIFFQNPEIFKGAQEAALRDDDKLLDKYVWEALRFKPVNPFVMRYAEEDFILGEGTSRQYKVKKGQILLVATQSAMFDEGAVKNAKEFRLDRSGVNDPNSIYYHFGFGHHKCLGDYVAQIEVPEIIKQLLKLPGIRAAEGGKIGRIGKHDNITTLEIEEDEENSPFPEHMVVQFDEKVDRGSLTIADPRFMFEDYLMNYDRNFFRRCLSNTEASNTIGTILRSIKVRKKYTDGHDLFLCRLPEKFHQCIGKGMAKGDYVNSYANCKGMLSEVEQYFYGTEVLGEPLIPSKIPASKTTSVNSGFEFEEDLKFFDRADYRQTFMNPVSLKSFPLSDSRSSEQLLFYARVPLEFRKCLAPKVLIKKMTRSQAFDTCMEDKSIRLDDLTVKYYKEIILKDELEE